MPKIKHELKVLLDEISKNAKLLPSDENGVIILDPNNPVHVEWFEDEISIQDDKWIVVSFWEHRSECGYHIEEFKSEREALTYADKIKEDDFMYVAKVIKS